MSLNPEELIIHADFIRQIAKCLIRDQELSHDISQDTMVEALAKPPASPLYLRAWLGSVTKRLTYNLIRRESRRSRREWVAAQPDHVPSTAEIVEHEETRKKVVNAVLKLNEAYRSVVLLRFYQDAPPRKIAEILNLPVETVKTRLKRAFAQLRKSLDQTYGGDRKEWCLALAPIAGLKLSAPSAAVNTSLALLAAKAKPALLALYLLLGISIPVLFFLWSGSMFSGEPDDNQLALRDPKKQSSYEDQKNNPLHLHFQAQQLEPLPSQGLLSLDPLESLRGRVVDLTGAPVANAKVQALRVIKLENRFVSDPLSSLLDVKSDANGYFLFEDIPKSKYALLACKGDLAGHTIAMAVNLHVHPSGRFQDYEIVMKPWRSIKGRVVDLDRKPVANAKLIAHSPLPHITPVSFASSDRSGAFELKYLIEGACYVQVTADGKAPEILNDVPTWSDGLEIVMESGHYIKGKVFLESKPQPGVRVFCACSNYQYVEVQVESVTRNDGSYLLGPLPTDPMYLFSELFVEAPGYSVLNKSKTPVHKDSINYEMDFYLIKNGSATGRIIDKVMETPLQGVTVTALRENKEAAPTEVKSDQNGAFSFPSLAPGDYRFIAHTSGHFIPKSSDIIHVGSNRKTEGVDILLEQGATIQVILTGENKELLEDANISVSKPDSKYTSWPFSIPYSIEDQGRGLYLIRGLAPGKYSVKASRRGWLPKSESITIPNSKKNCQMEMTLSFGQILKGHVTDLNGVGISGVSLIFGRGWNTYTDKEGEFCVHNIIPGEGYVNVKAQGYQDLKQYFTLSDEKKINRLDLILAPEGDSAIAGRIAYEHNGDPVTGVHIQAEQVLLKEATKLQRIMRNVKSDRNGSFQISGLADQPLSLSFKIPEGFVIGDFKNIQLKKKLEPIQVRRNAWIQGEMVDQQGQPVQDYRLIVVRDGKIAYSKTCKGSKFDINVRPGEYMVYSRSQNNMCSNEVQVNASPGEIVEGLLLVQGKQGALSGYIRDASSKKPVVGAQVFLSEKVYLSKNRDKSFVRTEISSRDGSFSFSGLKPGLYHIETNHPDYRQECISNLIVSGGTAKDGVEIQLEQGNSIYGRIYYPGGDFSKIRLRTNLVDRKQLPEIDNQGRYRIDHLSPGSGQLIAVIPGKRSITQVVHSFPLDKSDYKYDIHFGSGCFKGFVYLSGVLTKGVKIKAELLTSPDVTLDSASQFFATTESLEDGSFRLTNLVPGRYLLSSKWSRGQGEFTSRKEVFVMSDDVNTDLHIGDYPCGEVHGVVSEDSLPLSGVIVCLEGKDPEFSIKTKTKDNGSFYIPDAPAGNIVLKARNIHNGFGKTTQLYLKAGDSLSQDLAWTRGSGEILGDINCLGIPQDNTPINVTQLISQSEEGFYVLVNADKGQFRLGGLPCGLYRVTAQKPWRKHKLVRVENNKQSSVSFHFTPGDTSLSGCVSGVDSPSGDVLVLLLKEHASLPTEGQIFTHPADISGLERDVILKPDNGNIFEFRELQEGIYNLSLLRVAFGKVQKVSNKTIYLGPKDSIILDLKAP